MKDAIYIIVILILAFSAYDANERANDCFLDSMEVMANCGGVKWAGKN